MVCKLFLKYSAIWQPSRDKEKKRSASPSNSQNDLETFSPFGTACIRNCCENTVFTVIKQWEITRSTREPSSCVERHFPLKYEISCTVRRNRGNFFHYSFRYHAWEIRNCNAIMKLEKVLLLPWIIQEVGKEILRTHCCTRVPARIYVFTVNLHKRDAACCEKFRFYRQYAFALAPTSLVSAEKHEPVYATINIQPHCREFFNGKFLSDVVESEIKKIFLYK